MLNGAFFRFWLVDIFHFRTSLPLSHETFHSMYTQYALYQAGFLVPSLGGSGPFTRQIYLLTPFVGNLANVQPGCATKSDMRRSRKSRNFMCGTALFHALLILTAFFFFSQKSGQLGHSVVTDLLDDFGPTDDARDAVATLYIGELFVFSVCLNASHAFPRWSRISACLPNMPYARSSLTFSHIIDFWCNYCLFPRHVPVPGSSKKGT